MSKEPLPCRAEKYSMEQDQGNSAQREKYGNTALAQLERAVLRAQKLIETVEVALHPVLQPAADAAKDVSVCDAALPPYFEELRRLTGALYTSLDRLDDVISRIEL